VKRQGSIGLFGGFPPNTVLDLDPNVIHYNELVLTGSQNATIDQYRRTLELLPRLGDLRQTSDRHPQLPDRRSAEGLRIPPRPRGPQVRSRLPRRLLGSLVRRRDEALAPPAGRCVGPDDTRLSLRPDELNRPTPDCHASLPRWLAMTALLSPSLRGR
jgi:hypothetical protein